MDSLTAEIKRLLVREVGLIRGDPKRRQSETADNMLKQWAKGYLTHDRREINRDTGNGGGSALGRDVRRNNKENNTLSGQAGYEIDDTEYRRLNAVVNRMTEYNRMFIFRHYLHRRSGVKQFARKLDIPIATYYRDLGDARDEFIARGGI